MIESQEKGLLNRHRLRIIIIISYYFDNMTSYMLTVSVKNKIHIFKKMSLS
jgi:hypothetical protein